MLAALCAAPLHGYAASELQLDPVPAAGVKASEEGREARGVLRAIDQAMLSSRAAGQLDELKLRLPG